MENKLVSLEFFLKRPFLCTFALTPFLNPKEIALKLKASKTQPRISCYYADILYDMHCRWRNHTEQFVFRGIAVSQSLIVMQFVHLDDCRVFAQHEHLTVQDRSEGLTPNGIFGPWA